MEFVEGSVCDIQTVRRAVRGVGWVFHLAALASVPRSVADPRLDQAVNVRGTFDLLDASKAAGVRRLVFSSSCSVYGDAARRPTPETCPTRPASPYAASKLASENLCRLWTELYGLETVSLRYFNCFGPRQPLQSQYGLVIPTFLGLARAGKSPTIFGDGKQTRDFVYVADVVRANLRAARSAAAPGQVFNVGSGRARSVLEIARDVGRVLGVRVRPIFAPPRPGDPKHAWADLTTTRRTLGWTPRVPFREGLAETAAWLAAQAPAPRRRRRR